MNTEINIEKLNAVVETLKSTLKGGLIATDIWDRGTGLSLAGHNAQPAAVALFNKITEDIEASLKDAGFPELNRYYMLDMAGHVVMIIRHPNDLLQGVLVDSKATSVGLLLSVVYPKMEQGVKDAFRS
jgi:hypothetical protein